MKKLINSAQLSHVMVKPSGYPYKELIRTAISLVASSNALKEIWLEDIILSRTELEAIYPFYRKHLSRLGKYLRVETTHCFLVGDRAVSLMKHLKGSTSAAPSTRGGLRSFIRQIEKINGKRPALYTNYIHCVDSSLEAIEICKSMNLRFSKRQLQWFHAIAGEFKDE